MAFNILNRLYMGLLIILVVSCFYLLKFDFLFLVFLLIFISYEFIYTKFIQSYFIIFFLLLFSFFILLVSFNFFEKLYFFQFFFIVGIIFSKKYKKLFFIFSLYVFCLILFYIININRNIFYLIFLISFFNDTIAFITGRYLAGPLILPKISPNKTWSGTSISFVLSTLLLLILNFNFFLSIILSMSLFIGDIFFSYVKRYLNIKDFSTLLGSHGGILDRIDSMFFVAIIFQIYLVHLT